MEFLDRKTIKLGRLLSDLDKAVVKFISLLQKHSDYVVISGYVAILLGRNRATDDVDIFVPKISKQVLQELYADLLQNGYWCLNSSEVDDIFDLLITGHGVRFAVEPEVSPNFEVKFAQTIYDNLSLRAPLTVRVNGDEIKIAFLELQIAYKEEILKSNKDFEDAEYLRLVAKGHIEETLIGDYKKELRRKWQQK